MTSLARDDNRVAVIGGTSSAGDNAVVPVYVDPTTHRMLVDSSGGNFSDNETPTGAVNSSNAIFTLAHTPTPAASLQFFVNGQLQTAVGVDYTLLTATVTLNIPPPTGSILRCWYRY